MMIAVAGNTFPVKDQIKALGGRWNAADKCWMVPAHVAAQAQALVPVAAAPAAKAKIGELSGIMALFDKARKHLKFPAVELGVPALGPDFAMRISLAGAQAREPGSVTVTSAEKSGFDGRREWFGRVSLDGTYQPSQKVADAAAITARLQAFAADPAGIAAEHGRLTGRCCFCRLPLTDERSTAVGYGAKCADNYGLPWGARPKAFAEAAA